MNVGQLVHYVAKRFDDGGFRVLPAIVTKVGKGGLVNLQFFHNAPRPVRFAVDVPHAEDPKNPEAGTWRWIDEAHNATPRRLSRLSALEERCAHLESLLAETFEMAAELGAGEFTATRLDEVRRRLHELEVKDDDGS